MTTATTMNNLGKGREEVDLHRIAHYELHQLMDTFQYGYHLHVAHEKQNGFGSTCTMVYRASRNVEKPMELLM